jgi:PHS family inorganic phosphate transporter-like MFS transporter
MKNLDVAAAYCYSTLHMIWLFFFYLVCFVILGTYDISSLESGFSICTTKRACVFLSLVFFRFFLGLGIGGDYPLSSTIMSEFANKRTRGSFIAAVFSMQGFGILASATVTMVVCSIFRRASKPTSVYDVPPEADVAWRLILMIGSVPAALTYYWRMMMPETAR